jgi:CheY-like chemotaxis protein
MTAKQVDRLFSEFSQADNSTTRLHGGTGLGLSITKHLLSLMDGDIAVTSELGRGSRFTCSLALTPAPAAGDLNQPAVQGHRALIVDDHAPARTVLCTLLSHFGLECAEAASGPAALDLLRQAGADYAYVFVDWVMPGMGGEELIEAIHALPLARLPVIVVVSAYDLERIHERCDRQGLCHFLPKPVLPRDVRALLATGHGERITEEAVESMSDPTRLQGMHLLLVEDNLINQQIASEMLSYHGARVNVAGNGQEALDLLVSTDDNPYHAVLMDIQMPVMDGFEATRRLRAEPRFARLPIIAMTAHAMVEEKERCLTAGMDAHVAKPFSMLDLLEALGPYVPRSSFGEPTAGITPIGRSTADDAAPPPHPGLDLDQGLAHCGGNRELFDRIAAGYNQEFAGLAEALDGCLARGQWEELAVLAHSFKGLSGTIGAVDLQTLAGEIEQACETRSSKMPVLIDRLRHLLAATLLQLQPASAKATAPPPVAVDGRSPQEVLVELRRLLAESDSAAQDLWQDHELVLRAFLPPMLGKQMAQAIARFKFEEALHLLIDYQGQ